MPARKKTDTLNGNQIWTVNETALVRFGRRKGFSTKEISQALERSTGAVSQRSSKINQFENNEMPPNDPLFFHIQKALQLENRVYGNTESDLRDQWLTKLSRTRGSTFKQVRTSEVISEEKTMPVSQTHEEVDNKEPLTQRPLFSFHVTADTDKVERLLKIVFGR